MSLYHEAAEILKTAGNGGGSLKSLAFSKKGWKSDRKTLFALTTEAVKWSEILSEVIEKGDILGQEKQVGWHAEHSSLLAYIVDTNLLKLTPTLVLLLAHDLLFARRGVALPATHGLHAAIARHRARLTAELTKARLRRGCGTVDELRALVDRGGPSNGNGFEETTYLHPRWVRVNTIRSTLQEQLDSTFAEYERCGSLRRLTSARSAEQLLYLDEHIPNLVAVPTNVDLTKTTAYQEGMLILQDKASCFPAYLLDSTIVGGDIIDACAAPGNKTTHVAAITAGSTPELSQNRYPRIIACEKDPARSKTLSKMVQIAGADRVVTVRSSQDFMKLKPQAKEFANVRSLLLDPSCSGSGIVGRDEGSVSIHLPVTSQKEANGKKRKRAQSPTRAQVEDNTGSVEAEENQPRGEEDEQKLQARLTSLSGFQLRLLQHAMTFPAAERIAYSTCSIHGEENEEVVVKALMSDVAIKRGWRILRRVQQVDGLRKWHVRGDLKAVEEEWNNAGNELDSSADEITEACIRCTKASEDGTMGFFVAGFVRAPGTAADSDPVLNGQTHENGDEDDEEWQGFSEGEP